MQPANGHALMAQPKLLGMDEPSMGLSPAYVEQVFDIIWTINRRGVTIFMVEQNANMALSVADRAYVLQTGRVVLSRVTAELREKPADPPRLFGGAQAAVMMARPRSVSALGRRRRAGLGAIRAIRCRGGGLGSAVGDQFGELFVRRAARQHRLGNCGASFVFIAGPRIIGSCLRRVAVLAMQLA